jgi:hypothetical protein
MEYENGGNCRQVIKREFCKVSVKLIYQNLPIASSLVSAEGILRSFRFRFVAGDGDL